MRNLVPGVRYRVIARATSGQSGGDRAPGGRFAAWAAAEVEGNLEEGSGITLVLRPGMTLKGVVNLQAQRRADTIPPFEKISIVMTPIRRGVPTIDSSSPRPIPVERDGTFVAKDLLPGIYQFRTDVVGHRDWRLTSAALDGRELLDYPLELLDVPPSAPIRFVVSNVQTEIAGHVATSNSEGLSVVIFAQDPRLRQAGTRRLAVSQVATDGSYTVRGLPPGDYLMLVVQGLSPGASDPVASSLLQEWESNAVRVSLASGERRVQDFGR